MATAKRLYLYTVTLIGLVLLIGGAVSLLRIVVNRIGVGPQGTTTSSANLDTLSISAAFGIVGLVVWATHWAMIEHMVRPARPAATALPDPGAPERQSIVRSVFFFVVLYFALTYCLELLDDLAGRTVADVLAPASSMNVLGLLGFGDDWEVSLVAVLLVVWAYHAWVRVRDVRQGPVIAGAAAWISRFYLYYLALGALLIVLENIGSIVSTVAAQWASVPDVPTLSTSFDVTVPTLAGAASDWERPLIMAAVSPLFQ